MVQSWKGHITFLTVFFFVFYRCPPLSSLSLSGLTLQWVCQQALTVTVHDWFISQLTVHTRQHIFFCPEASLAGSAGFFFVNGGSLGRWAPTSFFFYCEHTGPKITEARKKSINKFYTLVLPLSYISTATDSISLISTHFIATLSSPFFKSCLILVSVLGCWLLIECRVSMYHYNNIFNMEKWKITFATSILFSWSSWIMNLDMRSSHQAFSWCYQRRVWCSFYAIHSQRAHYHPSLQRSKDSSAAGFVASHFTDGSLFLLL